MFLPVDAHYLNTFNTTEFINIFYSTTNAQVIVLKAILKFTLK